jgi:aspartate/methionine/tyrosine aminotransferase
MIAAMRPSNRMAVIGTETAFEAAARARALEASGRSVIHLEIGEPDFDTPVNVREAAKTALDEGKTHYPPFPGIPDLRAAIADDAAARKGFAVDPANVFVTVGGKGVMVYAIMALIDPGDEVIVPDPGYPIYESITNFMGGTPVPIPIRMEHDFRLDVDELASLITPRTKLLVINSPANPTGGVLTRDDIERIAELALRHELVVLADEIYGRILYDGAEHVSIASLPGMAERTVVLDGFSKTYAMTGWRLGYAIVPPWLVQAFGTLIINTISGATAFAQAGAVEALRGPQDDVDAMVEEFLARRDLIVDGLNAIPGFECLRPQGAFYVFPRISGTGLDGPALADRLLQEAGVSVLSGTAFGKFGRDHIRVSYANSRANLAEGLRRIRSVVDHLAVEGLLPEAAMAKAAGTGSGAAAESAAGTAPSPGS